MRGKPLKFAARAVEPAFCAPSGSDSTHGNACSCRQPRLRNPAAPPRHVALTRPSGAPERRIAPARSRNRARPLAARFAGGTSTSLTSNRCGGTA